MQYNSNILSKIDLISFVIISNILPCSMTHPKKLLYIDKNKSRQNKSSLFYSIANMKTTVRLVCLAIFVTVSTASTKHLYEPRIINGHDATEGQFPHMASLQNRFTHQHYCGAAILSSRFLLTAAHCCHGDQGNPKMVIAIVGALRLSSGGVKVELDTITPHGGFSFHTARNDIGVIRTVKEIEFTDLVQPIALSTVDLPDDRTTQVILSGWGRFEVYEVIIFPSNDILQL